LNQADDIALIFLKDQSQTRTAVQNLNGNRTTLEILHIFAEQDLIAKGYGDPTKDPGELN